MRNPAIDFARAHLFGLSVGGSMAIGFVGWLGCLDLHASVLLNLMNLVAAPLAGGVCGVVLYHLLWWLLRVVRRWRGREIVKGCRVRILGGPHRDTIGEVYETLDSRGEVRVALGEEAKRAVTDVFMMYQVERIA